MSRREPDVLLEDILNCILSLMEFTEGFTLEKFSGDKRTKDAIIRNLEVVGEAASKLSKEFRQKYDHIPWVRIIAMRNKMIHEYFGIEEEVIWKVATEDAPELYRLVKLILDELDSQNGN